MGTEPNSVALTPPYAERASKVRSVRAIADFWALTKPEVNLLILITTFAGFYLGSSSPLNGLSIILLTHTLLGTLLVASGAGALNQYVERRFDSQMRRTARRPLASGRIESAHALWFGVSVSLAGTVYLALAAGLLASLLALVTLLTYLFLYTPLKRKTSLCTLIGAFPGAMPPLIGWAAARGQLNPEAWVLYAMVFLWQFPHFMAIAWLYRDDYAKAGIRMLPVVQPDGWSTVCEALIYAVLMIPVSVVPFYLHLTGTIYLVAAILLGLVYLAYTIRFARITKARTTTESRGYARDLLRASVIYLPLLLTVMMLNATGRR
jgi:protoheme IX farnesyltransferase